MKQRTGPYTILIVDDAFAVREALSWAFEDIANLTIIGEAHNGQQAIDRAQALAPDVVILDLELPDINGYQVAQQLKDLRSPPLIVFLTIHNEVNLKQRCLAVGDGFVEKSKGWAALIAEITEVVVKC